MLSCAVGLTCAELCYTYMGVVLEFAIHCFMFLHVASCTYGCGGYFASGCLSQHLGSILLFLFLGDVLAEFACSLW